MSRIRHFFRKLFILSLVLAGLLVFDLGRFLARPNPHMVIYLLTPNKSLWTVSNELTEQKVIIRPLYFAALASLPGQWSRVQRGEYEFLAGITPYQILRQFIAGKVRQYILQIREGWMFDHIMAIINLNPHFKHELAGLSKGAVMLRLGLPGRYPEGLFFPDTYFFSRDMTDVAFLKRAYRHMQKKLAQAWEKRDPQVPYKSSYEALIVASLIEKETGIAEERPLVASVILNRLKKNMRLQIDATVIYALGSAYRGRLTYHDLEFNSAYNTYRQAGLPPTPIAMPSLAAIEAALHPQASPYLYYVAKGDGGHQFSATWEQHQRAVRNYRRIQAAKP